MRTLIVSDCTKLPGFSTLFIQPWEWALSVRDMYPNARFDVLLPEKDKVWGDYWSGIYNRIERGIGWMLLSVSGILLLIYGGYSIVDELIADPTVGFILKVAILGFIGGMAVLFVSVLRERIFFWKTDRYRNVRR